MYLIDNSNFCYKFKNVHNYAKASISGVDVDISVLVGYMKTIKQIPFEHIIICLDGYPARSKELLPSYKGTRNNESSLSLGVPWNEIIKFLSQIGTLYDKDVKVVCSPCQEADQVIASISFVASGVEKQASVKDFINTKPLSEDKILHNLSSISEVQKLDIPQEKVVIGTTDSDMFQLMRLPNVFIDSSTTGRRIITEGTPKAVFNLNPSAIVIYKAIFGDISDNVPSLGIDHKSNVLKILDECITDNSSIDYFICQVHNPCDTSYVLHNLTKEIHNHNLKEFVRNLEIVKLSFVSTPLVLSFPDYSIQETLQKYSLKI